MNLKELKKEKHETERELSRIIHGEIVKFYEKTGVWVDSAWVSLTPVSEMGREDYSDVLVSATLNIEV